MTIYITVITTLAGVGVLFSFGAALWNHDADHLAGVMMAVGIWFFFAGLPLLIMAVPK